MTPWRTLVYDRLREIPLRGRVLDLGGSRKSRYHELLPQVAKFDVVNLDEQTLPDYSFDLENTFPLTDAVYDGVLCMNILEHLYHYRQFLSECHRVLKEDGMLVIAVPFLVQVHPSPRDYFRYTDDALRLMLTDAGFSNISIQPLGSGVGVALAQLSYNALRFGIVRTLAEWAGTLFDRAISLIKKDSFLSGKYYPLGYIVTARK